jgi:hypothetical protein
MIDMRNRLPPFSFRVAIAFLTIISFALMGLSPSYVPDQSWFAGGFREVPGRGAYGFGVPEARSVAPETELSGSVHGYLLDESDVPVMGIEVDLIPANKTKEFQWVATHHEWADNHGEYTFGDVEEGEYFLAVHKDNAPDEAHPFATAYYPGTEDDGKADHIFVAGSVRTELHPLRLRRIETVTIDVHVIWEDGTPVERSNLLFHNLNFPDQAVIGDVAPGIIAGRGQFTIPKGFEYYARAVVHCDSGAQIESRESRPVQQIKIGYGSFPQELTFVIPGPPCVFWTPSSR